MSLPYIVTQKAFSTEFPAPALLKVENLNLPQIRSQPVINAYLHPEPKVTGQENLQFQNLS